MTKENEKWEILFPQEEESCYYWDLYLLKFKDKLYLKKEVSLWDEVYRDEIIITDKNIISGAFKDHTWEYNQRIIRNIDQTPVYQILNDYKIIRISELNIWNKEISENYKWYVVDLMKDKENFWKLVFIFRSKIDKKWVKMEHIPDTITFLTNKELNTKDKEILFLGNWFKVDVSFHHSVDYVFERKGEKLVFNKKLSYFWRNIPRYKNIFIHEGDAYKIIQKWDYGNWVVIVEKDKTLTLQYREQMIEGFNNYVLVWYNNIVEYIVYYSIKHKKARITDISWILVKELDLAGFDSLYILKPKNIFNLQEKSAFSISPSIWYWDYYEEGVIEGIQLVKNKNEFSNKIQTITFDRDNLLDFPILKSYETEAIFGWTEKRFIDFYIILNWYKNLQEYLEGKIVDYYAKHKDYGIEEAENLSLRPISNVKPIIFENGIDRISIIRFDSDTKSWIFSKLAFLINWEIVSIHFDMDNSLEFVKLSKGRFDTYCIFEDKKTKKVIYFFLDKEYDNNYFLEVESNKYRWLGKYSALNLEKIFFTYNNKFIWNPVDEEELFLLKSWWVEYEDEADETYLVKVADLQSDLSHFQRIILVPNLYLELIDNLENKKDKDNINYYYNCFYSRTKGFLKDKWVEGIILEEKGEDGEYNLAKDVVDIMFNYKVTLACSWGIEIYQRLNWDFFIEENYKLKNILEKKKNLIKLLEGKKEVFKNFRYNDKTLYKLWNIYKDSWEILNMVMKIFWKENKMDKLLGNNNK